MKHRFDEDDVRVRPSKRNRPRTRRRPTHSNSVRGVVTAVDRGRYRCVLDDSRVITAITARELGRGAVVVGDNVRVVGEFSTPDSLGRIVRVEKRSSVLRRSADDGDTYERIVVANATRVVIVVSLADPPPRLGLIDRCLVAAEDAGITPLIVLTKSDLASDESVHAYYAASGVRTLTWQRGHPVHEILTELRGESSVLVGHSGVGKSTLVNAVIPDAERHTGIVSEVGKGRHTSTSVRAFAVPGGGWVIDTPGIRSFGLAHIPRIDLVHGFSEIVEGSALCEPGCDHAEARDSCALDVWCNEHRIPPARLESLRSLIASVQN